MGTRLKKQFRRIQPKPTTRSMYKHRKGTPPILSAKVIEKFEKLLITGSYVNVACAYMGIEEKTFYNWINRGEECKAKLENDPETALTEYEVLCVDFLQSIRQAQSKAEIRSIVQLRKGVNVKGHGFFLERKFSERWRRRDFVQSENTTTNLNIEAGKCSMDELLPLLKVETQREILDAMRFLEAKKVESVPTPKQISNG